MSYQYFSSTKRKKVKAKAKEVNYQQMSSEAIEDMLADFRNELRGVESRREWLSGEIEVLQAILDERVQESCEE